jgi:peptidoglycan/LPS O-acetylase OafA/YrhL
MAVLSPARAPRFPLLDSIRAIAALTVVGYHAAYLSHIDATGSASAPFLSRLDVGVTIFFLLSGFLLYRPFVRARLRGEPSPGAGAYGWRRALRILPAYWVALTVLALILHQRDTFIATHALAYYGLAQTYTDVALGGIAQAWTLNVEVCFYALLPLWALLLRRIRVPATVRAELVALAVLALVGIAWNVAWTVTAADPHRANVARPLIFLPAFFDHFALGMALAVVSVGGEGSGRPPRGLGWLARRAWPACSWPSCSSPRASGCRRATRSRRPSPPRSSSAATGSTRPSRSACCCPPCSGRRTAGASGARSGTPGSATSASCPTACTSGTSG